MADWIESYRGVVNAWECDIVEHFTIAYYFDKFADATRNFLDLIGEGESLVPEVNKGPSRLHVTFRHELRAGNSYHILSAVTGLDAETLQLGHQMINSTTGETGTWIHETLRLPAGMSAPARQNLQQRITVWPGPDIPERIAARASGGLLTARDRVRTSELGEHGSLSLPAHVHRFSGAAMQALSAIGMSGAYMQANRRGFSTFELDVLLVSEAKAGDIVDVTTAVTHIGNSSVRILHTMRCHKTGRELALMGQSGVHLDMEARRSTPMPPELKNLAQKLLAS